MLHIIPSVKQLEIQEGFLKKKSICYDETLVKDRLKRIISKIPYDENGVNLIIDIVGESGEEYEIKIDEASIFVKAESEAGAFYAIQTLRQIFEHDDIPCLYIKDKPDFLYRGFYHDATRGKVPTVATIKKLVDDMAYYKLNSLQLYVEHTFEFEEYKNINHKTGYFTAQEIKEIDQYCQENFVEFIPSLSTFGHLYELLEQDEYKHLCVLKNYKTLSNFWLARMMHHTIDPLNAESIEVIKRLIDQYEPHFQSEYFNICCDETFDLKVYDEMGYDSGKIYVDFVKKIISHVQKKGKKVMMWADILLLHPETIEELPEDVCFLNWDYEKYPSEEKVIQFQKLGRRQIVCPGTTTWSRLCENVDIEESNICLMAEYGYKHGAMGVLNTNWGDWGNPCSLELAMYGMVLGAEKSWSALREIDDDFYASVNKILYKNENGIQCLKALSDLHEMVSWWDMCRWYIYRSTGDVEYYCRDLEIELDKVQKVYSSLKNLLSEKAWGNDEYRQEMLLAAEGLCVIAELLAVTDEEIAVKNTKRITNTKTWLEKYCQTWMKKNKKSELDKIQEMFLFVEQL